MNATNETWQAYCDTVARAQKACSEAVARAQKACSNSNIRAENARRKAVAWAITVFDARVARADKEYPKAIEASNSP